MQTNQNQLGPEDLPTPETPNDQIICYCFNIRLADYINNPALKEFVLEKTKAGLCSCKTQNPSGNCCLKDFPRLD